MLQTAIIRASDKTLPNTSDYFLVLGENHNWAYLAEKNPWFLSITDYCGYVVMQSEHLAPNLGLKMFGYEHGSKQDLRYGITGSLEELLELRERYLDDPYTAGLVLQSIKGLDCCPRIVTGPIENLVKQEQDRKVAQSQAAINSTKITRLEKELKQARELQKLLKKLR